MKNRITFPEGGMETKYVWDKHSLNNNGIYIWDKHSVITEPHYYWDKYTIDERSFYRWEKYAVNSDGTKGEYVGEVSSKNKNQYPTDGIQNGHWYVYILEGTHYWKVYSGRLNYQWDKYTYSPTNKIASGNATRQAITNFSSPVTLVFGINHGTGSIVPFSVSVNPTLVDLVDEFEPYAYRLNADGTLDRTDVYEDAFVILYTTNSSGQKYTYHILTDESEIIRTTIGSVTFTNTIQITCSNGAAPAPIGTGEKHPKFFYEGNVSSSIPYRVTETNLSGHKVNTTYTPVVISTNLRGVVYPDTPSESVVLDETLADYNAICDTLAPKTKTAIRYVNGYRYSLTNLTYLDGPDEYIESVIANVKGFYPDNGIKQTSSGSYWYIYTGYTGSYTGEVSSRNRDEYPDDGYRFGSTFVYDRFEEDAIGRGEYLETVESLNRNQYPDNYYEGNYWYLYKEMVEFYYKGNYISEITEEKITAYPDDKKKGDYWYVYKGFENNGPYKSKWIEQVETNDSSTYPYDGINGYYWYVYNKSYQGYKDQITDDEIRGGVTYKQTINPEEDYTIGCAAAAEIELDYDNRNNKLEKYASYTYCDYYTWQPNDTDWRLIGRFYFDNMSHSRKLVNIKAFDAIGIDGDTFMDAFITQTTFPITVRQFFKNICSTLGYECSIDENLVNLDFEVQDNFEAINITARQLLQYVAEMCAGFVRVDNQGVITLRSYNKKDLDLNNSQYTKTSIANYTIANIDALTVRTTNDDLGVSAGNGNNKYIIENNPLFYAQSNDEIQKEVNNIYNKLREVSYVPADIELLQDFGIECGDIITLNGATFYVMEKEISASGCELNCVGNKVRAQQESGINSDIVALRGKTNELYRDLEMTKSTLTDTANGLQSQITQTAKEINLRVTNEVEGLESEISQTAEQISLRVTNEVAGLESKITQTADSITSTVTDQINETKSEIKQTTDSISLKVDSQGELVAQLVLDVNGINARGYVTFTDLAGTGTTVINGSNITTGTISADRINMKGAISWGDLDADCKETIASYAGQDGDDADVPDYIHNTYIDATRIVSPTIQGGTLSAGTTADGYMKLSSTGLNFHSSEKPICGIGYYTGNKELPYIVLGAGVDDYGTDQGMIKKYTNGIWIGDSDGLEGNSPTGTGIFINFNTGAVQKYVNGSASAL